MMREVTGTPQLPSVARVLLDSGLPQLDHLFDYEIPEPLRAEIRIGHRVKVPFRSRQRDSLGYVIELAEASEFQGELNALTQIVSPVPQLSSEIWQLIRTVADRAGGSAADLIRLAVPNRHVRTEKSFLAEKERTEQEHAEQPEQSEQSEPAQTGELQGHTVQQAHRLREGHRLALSIREHPVRLETGQWVSAWAHQLAELAIAIYRLGQSVIIAVPDYRDIDQVNDTLHALGHSEHVRLDSRQTGADRYRNFLHASEPQARIILGNRSVIYAPAHDLGAILMWNDGDPLFHEPLSPYVHARDVALVRAQQTNAGIVCSSHTMSSEVQRLVDMGYFVAVTTGTSRPSIMHTGSLAGEEIAVGRIPELATKMLRQGLQEGPVLVQVATPGYVPVLVCARCRDLAACAECRGPVGQTAGGQQICRWCGETARSLSCNTCHNTTFEMRGAGSERTAAQFEKIFPETMVILSDGAHQRSRVDARPAVVVATRGAEPIAAGGYRAVVFLDVDRIVSAPTLRAGEDALRWWHGAMWLAQRGAPVVITGGAGQVVRAFATGREVEWLRGELRERQTLRFPPAVRVVTVTGARELVQEALLSVRDIEGVDVLGPTPIPDENVRAIVRFSYAMGAEVASTLRAVLVSQAGSRTARAYATRKTSQSGPASRKGSAPGALRLKFDDISAFDDQGDET